MDYFTLILRFIIVFLLSALFGLERQRTHKPVGFGTFIFVSLGACALAMIPTALSIDNPLAIISAIVTGIGFLGAGALIKTTDKIFGFTTAASIWAFAILGLTIGLGLYPIAGIMYALIWAIILIDWYFEKHGIGSYQRKLTIIANKLDIGKEIKKAVDKFTIKNKLIITDINRKENKLTMVYLIEGAKEELNNIPQHFYEKQWLDSCKIE
ncbi:MAG TPA: MgtC/SapB family protein [Candidatus Nanoarchaeia archaeon]|nr:MgtC/SapB family protein [Candidatus Nanoarchaeia archaeon]